MLVDSQLFPWYDFSRLKKALKAGQVCIGSMVSSFRTPQIAQIYAVQGWDYLIMDTEHSFFDYSGLADLFTVARTEEIVPLVRVTVATYPYLARALDIGAMGVICPHIETPKGILSVRKDKNSYRGWF